MELLCAVPRTSKSNSWANWVPGGGKDDRKTHLARSTSIRGDEFAKLFGVASLRTRRTTVSGSVRSTRSAGSTPIYSVLCNTADPTRPLVISSHIIPPSSPNNTLSHEAYSTPLSVVDSFAEFSGSPLRRSQTLPPIAIRRSGDRGLAAQLLANDSNSTSKQVVREQSGKGNINEDEHRLYAVPNTSSGQSIRFASEHKAPSESTDNDGGEELYDAMESEDSVLPLRPSDPLRLCSDNQRRNRSPASRGVKPRENSFLEPIYGDNSTYSSAQGQNNGIPDNVRLCQRHSLASSSSSSSSSRFASLLGDDPVYSGALSETGSSVSSFGTSTDEGVYSASSITASSIYSSCGRDSETDEACLGCQKEAEGGRLPARRSRTTRSARHLPVTPTLRRLLQMGLDQPSQDNRSSLSSALAAPSSPTPTYKSSSSSSSTTTAIHNHVLPSTSSSSTSATAASATSGVIRRERLHPPRTDTHRLSKANLEDSGDLELDAILGELCALGSQFEIELKDRAGDSSHSVSNTTPITAAAATAPAPRTSCSVTRPTPQQPLRDSKSKFDGVDGDQPNPTMSRTDSPDNDSAFSDSVSVLSSESSASSGASNAQRQHQLQANQMDNAAQIKAEKIKLALEKIKEANVKKLFLKAFSRDGSSKSLLVDEKMTVAHVTRLLADKNHVTMDPKWTIVEHLPDLYMERVYEDDEMLVENLLLWARDSQNKLFFLDRPDKYMLFWQPEQFLNTSQAAPLETPLDDEARNNMIEEFFSSGSVPETEGPLFLKSEGKKMWKKFYFVLRKSGLYYCPKGKSSRSSKDLVCLITFEGNQVYQGVGWRKKHKSPTEWGFAIKPAALQSKSSKYIKYLCTDDAASMHRWITAIRIAKFGRRLMTNYRALIEDLAQEDIDLFASSRSFSLASVAAPSNSQATTPSSESRSLDSCLASSVATSAEDSDRDDDCDSDGATPVNTLNRQHSWSRSSDLSADAVQNNSSIYNTLASTASNSSSSSSGCMSHRSNASTPSTEHGFESEFSQQGTIKRKPAAATPKIPLTNTTRQMLHDRDFDCADSVAGITNGGAGGNSIISTLRQSLRRSITDEASSSIKRRNSSSSTLPRGFSAAKQASEDHNTHATLPSMPAPSLKSAEVDGLPLPLPLPEVDPVDPSLLPPPPPELLASTLSLASLPPPPDDISPPNPDEMTCSMISLPPPPPPLTLPLLNTDPSYQVSPPTPPLVSQKPKSPPPPPVAPKPRRVSESSPLSSPVSPPVGVIKNKPPVQPPPKPKKKISFREDVQNIPPSIYSPSPSPPSPSSPCKPPPPPRSDSTRLSSSPQRLSHPANKLTPPRAFLTNLQKVMQRKWQVAEKCKDFDQNPHEVLGFRDSLLPPTETQRNVGLWIQEHYGNIYDHLGNNPNNQNGCGDSDNLPSPPLPSPPPMSPTIPPQAYAPVSGSPEHGPAQAASNRLSQSSLGRKKPPPPPPKRSDSTHLSSRH